jgi:hypothetical protein
MVNIKGNPRRLWNISGGQEFCKEDHTNNPKVTADVEWLRFIRTFIKMWPDEPTDPFSDTYENKNKRLVLHSYHDFFVEGHVYPYCEEYWIVKPNSTSEWALIFAIYLDNDNKKSNISCFDQDYVEMCDKVYAAVQQQYIEDAK